MGTGDHNAGGNLFMDYDPIQKEFLTALKREVKRRKIFSTRLKIGISSIAYFIHMADEKLPIVAKTRVYSRSSLCGSFQSVMASIYHFEVGVNKNNNMPQG